MAKKVLKSSPQRGKALETKSTTPRFSNDFQPSIALPLTIAQLLLNAPLSAGRGFTAKEPLHFVCAALCFFVIRWVLCF